MTLAERLEAARSGAAVGPVEERGVLRLAGRDALALLHRMGTQDVAKLRPGESRYAAFLDAKGHLVGDAMVHAREGEVLLVGEAAAAPTLAAHLRRYVLRDDVRVEERSAGLRGLCLLGEAGLARAPAGTALDDPRRGAPARCLLLPAGEAEQAREALVGQGFAALSAGDLEVLRVLGGVPRFGADMDGSRLVIEAALTGPAVSFDKGCYLGQEVVLRGTFRGQVQRGLVQLELPAGAGPGAKLRAPGPDGQEVGWVTSAADAPEGRVGLGYLRRAHWREGERLATDGGEARVRRALVQERER
jgi:folate-binding protein YgfZ